MTRAEIAAELRRSACEDVEPYCGCAIESLIEAGLLCGATEWMDNLTQDDCRTFFLLVAEAIND